MIIDAGYAWPEPVNGVYPRVEYPPNHSFLDMNTEPYYIFDNYIDPTDGDFYKQLAPNYALYDYGYRLIIRENPYAKDNKFIARIKSYIDYLIGIKTS